MDFTIVTPSFRQLKYLGSCIASVADQGGVSVEHIVQDGGTEAFEEFSKEINKEWPPREGCRRVMVSEKDEGMYDAINRGLKKATGKICAYLNCDEQYLPGALSMVQARFEADPSVDVFLGDVIVVAEDGSPICLRKIGRPGLAHTWTCHFAALTAGIFFRNELVRKQILFDTSYRAAADAEWFVRILRAGFSVKRLGFTTSTFMEAGENLGLSPAAIQERKRLNNTAPAWMRGLRPYWVASHRFCRWMGRCHQAEDMEYAIHVPRQKSRKTFHATRLRTTWPGRMWGF